MRYAILVFLLICQFIPDALEWQMSASLIERMVSHHFLHGNILHLLVNALAIWQIYKRWSAKEMALAWGIASVSYLAATIPAIGFSNIIFATIGLRTPSFKSLWWKQPTTLAFLVVSALMCFLPNVSAVTHIVSFCMGVCHAMLTRWFRRVSNDAERYI